MNAPYGCYNISAAAPVALQGSNVPDVFRDASVHHFVYRLEEEVERCHRIASEISGAFGGALRDGASPCTKDKAVAPSLASSPLARCLEKTLESLRAANADLEQLARRSDLVE